MYDEAEILLQEHAFVKTALHLLNRTITNKARARRSGGTISRKGKIDPLDRVRAMWTANDKP